MHTRTERKAAKVNPNAIDTLEKAIRRLWFEYHEEAELIEKGIKDVKGD